LTYDNHRTIVIVMNLRRQTKRSAPLPTEAELEILTTLWTIGPSTVREVHEALSSRQTGYTTVLKQMQVMAEKGLLVRNERYRSHVYEARLPKEETQRQLAGNLLQRAFDGSAKNLVLGALSSQRVSSSELSEIRRVLDEFEKGSK
jgi:BlaI family transcriptional regulator, penicillinase repressor